jgi:hypothetical protein
LDIVINKIPNGLASVKGGRPPEQWSDSLGVVKVFPNDFLHQLNSIRYFSIVNDDTVTLIRWWEIWIIAASILDGTITTCNSFGWYMCKCPH